MTNNLTIPSLPTDTHSDADMFECVACGTPVEQSDPLEAQDGRPKRLIRLREAVEARRGVRGRANVIRYSAGFVVEQAADRYFCLIEETQAGLQGQFTPDEFSVLQNMEPSPVWNRRDIDLASKLHDTYADEDDCLIPSLSDLARRLADLTPVQQVAMVDACERVFRGYDNPLL